MEQIGTPRVIGNQKQLLEEHGQRKYILQSIEKINLSKRMADIGNFSQLNWPLVYKYGLDKAALLAFLVSKFNLYEETGNLTKDKAFYCTTSTIKDIFKWSWNKQNQLLDDLEKAGLIKMSVRGTPPKKYVNIQFEKLLEAASGDIPD